MEMDVLVKVFNAIADTVAKQIVFYFVQKILDNWWNANFPQS